jgi:cell division protein FtsB
MQMLSILSKQLQLIIRGLIVLLLMVAGLSDLHANNSTKALLEELDHVLLNGLLYMEQKEHRINRLKIQLEQEPSVEKIYDITYRIIDEYKSYMSDSALIYVNRNIRLAEEYNNMYWLTRAKLQYSFVLSSSGLFVESENVLNSISVEELKDELLVDYYKCLELLYININIYQEGKQILTNYRDVIRNSRDSILHFLPENANEKLFYKFLIADTDNRLDTALVYLNAYLDTLHPGTHEHARKSYSLSMLYERMGNTELQVQNLILAVISDVKDAVKENRALLDLSIWLYEQNDIDRAFRYIRYALDDANFYNARFRYFEISKALPIITTAYQQYSEQQSNRLKTMLYIISFLSVGLLIMLSFLYKQMLALRQARKVLKENNDTLAEANENLNQLNHDLSEANLVKEEYLGYFLDLCSEYIGNLEEYRKIVSNKIAAKRFDELLRTTNNSSGKANEIKELYANFDKAFLNIYPGFVSSFNELLKDEYRFEIRKGELLNTELRIFALIRLGITDSAKIATFLRCSVQTVYNYRSKIKRISKNESIDIEEDIKKICSPHIA